MDHAYWQTSQFSDIDLISSGYNRSNRLNRNVKTNEYLVPETVRILYENKFEPSVEFGLDEILLLEEVTNAKQGSPLTVNNYKSRLKLLNQLEDVHVNYEFRYCFVVQPRLDLVDRSDGGFKWQISRDQMTKFSTIIKEDVGVRFILDNGIKLTGTVDKVNRAFVTIFTEKEIPCHRVIKLEFLHERTSFQMEYRALEMLEQSVIEKVLFASSYTESKALNISSFKWFRPSVASNPEQVQAIRNIVNQTSFPAPYILVGPPGTGKTSTLVETIGQIYKLRCSANVLIVATSNSAANELTSRLLKIIPGNDIFRFFARSCARKTKDIERDVLHVSNLSGRNIGMNNKDFYENIRPGRVVICTASAAGRLVDSKIPNDHFNYIFIDECGSAKEICSLVPIMSIGVQGDKITASIVLAGDPKQLGPVIPYDYLKGTTHSVSLLERILDKGLYVKNPQTKMYDPKLITILRDNFRSHPALLEFSNRMFYSQKLRAKASPEKTHWAVGWISLTNRTFPLIFHPVVGSIKQDENSSSMYNEQEAKLILLYVITIMDYGICGRKIEQAAIGIITPYASQVRYLKDLLNKRGWGKIEVGSTEQYQGREKPIMLMSTVRTGSKSVGFLGNEKRLNVSLTRPQALMIVVGDSDTLQNNRHWAKFIKYCEQHNAIVKSSICFGKGMWTESSNARTNECDSYSSLTTLANKRHFQAVAADKNKDKDYAIVKSSKCFGTGMWTESSNARTNDCENDQPFDYTKNNTYGSNSDYDSDSGHTTLANKCNFQPGPADKDYTSRKAVIIIAALILGYIFWR